MPLSDEERQRLAQLEASLAEDDPSLAHTLRGTKLAPPPTITTLNTQPTHSRPSGKLAAVAGVGAVAGIGLLIAGIPLHWSVSVAGFLLMFIAALLGIGVLKLPSAPAKAGSFKSGTGRGKVVPKATSKIRARKPHSSGPFMDRLEERWRRRQDGR